MKLQRNFARFAMVGLLALAVAGPASAVTRKERNTVIGLGVGALAGAVITNGDPLMTLGGAAAGGLLGNVLTEDRRDRHYSRPGRHVERRDYRRRDVRYENRRHHRDWDRHR